MKFVFINMTYFPLCSLFFLLIWIGIIIKVGIFSQKFPTLQEKTAAGYFTLSPYNVRQ